MFHEVTHIKWWRIVCSLGYGWCDHDMPQVVFNNVKGTDVAHLDFILLVEPLPAQTYNMVAALFVRRNTHLPICPDIH
jgi:hypothetical protein